MAPRGKIYFFKILLFGVLVLINDSDDFFEFYGMALLVMETKILNKSVTFEIKTKHSSNIGFIKSMLLKMLYQGT